MQLSAPICADVCCVELRARTYTFVVKILAYIPDFDESTVHGCLQRCSPRCCHCPKPALSCKFTQALASCATPCSKQDTSRSRVYCQRNMSKEAVITVAALLLTGAICNMPGKLHICGAAGGSSRVSEIYMKAQAPRRVLTIFNGVPQTLSSAAIMKRHKRLCGIQVPSRRFIGKNSAVCIVPAIPECRAVAVVYRASDTVMLHSSATPLRADRSTQVGQLHRPVATIPVRLVSIFKYILTIICTLSADKRRFSFAYDQFLCQFPVLVDKYNDEHRIAAERERTFAQRRAKSMATFIEIL